MKSQVWTAALGLAVVLFPQIIRAEDRAVQGSLSEECRAEVTRSNVVRCALAASPALREELAGLRSSEGRRVAARPVLPANPVISGSVASRSTTAERALNWNIGLAQEIEVAGQRGLRIDAAARDVRAQSLRVDVAKAAVAEQTWGAYFSALAANERRSLAARLEAATEAVASTVRGMASAGLASEVDADVADGAAVRAAQERLEADGAVAAAETHLGLLVGRSGRASPTGTLEPLATVESTAPTPTERPEVLAAQEDQAALRRRVDLLRRSRAPNPSISVFAQSDGFNERVFGVGLSLPMPLPQPVGRTLSGELAEATGSADRAAEGAGRLARELRAEAFSAATQYQISLKIRSLYTKDRMQRASARLDNIAAQVKAARLPVREALVAQQALVDQLKADIDARESLCLASVRLSRASGQSLEGQAL